MVINDDDILFAFNTYEEFRKERLKINYESTLKLWYSLPSGLPTIDNQRVKGYTSYQQRVHMGKVSLFAVYCTLFKRTFLKKKISSKGSRLWHQSLNLSSTDDEPLLDLYQSLCDVTMKFVNKAERYDSTVSNDNLFKAGRAVWFTVSLQLQLNVPLILSDSILGYNMLYPYTDDLVDSNDVPREAKQDFARIFHERLLIGDLNYDQNSHFDGRQSNVDELELPSSLKPFADRVGKIFDMVKFIENDWIRNDEHKGVYMSLATIHECQMKSTLQHARPDDGYAPTMAAIEEISAQKGGASIIAAGFLVEGQLTRAKMAYLEYVGFGLQLLDDLQDVEEDMKNNHRTIFTQSIAEGQTLDVPTARLIQYLYSTAADEKFLESYLTVPNAQSDTKLAGYIHASMVMIGVMLVLEAASHLRQYYSKSFYCELSRLSPIRFQRLKRARIEKRMWYVFRQHWF